MEKPKTKIESVIENGQLSHGAKVIYTWLYLHRTDGELVDGKWEFMLPDDKACDALGIGYTSLKLYYNELKDNGYIEYTRRYRTWTDGSVNSRRITLL